LTKLGTYRQIFIKVSSNKFHGNRSGGSRADSCRHRRTDGHWQDNRRFSPLRERV